MTEAKTIRAASSRWLRTNEIRARKIVTIFGSEQLQAHTGWSAWQVNNMLTYLALVDDAA